MQESVVDLTTISAAASLAVRCARDGDIDGARQAVDALARQFAGHGAAELLVCDWSDEDPDVWASPLRAVRPQYFTRTDGAAMFYEGKSHVIAAESTAGKTWVAISICQQMSREGHRVVYLDFEDDRKTFADRWRKLGGTLEQIRQTRYLNFGAGDLTAGLTALWDYVQHAEVDFVVIDGVSRSMSRMGLEEVDGHDVDAWTEAIISPMLARGIGTVALDHISHASRLALRQGHTKAVQSKGSINKTNVVTGAVYNLVVNEPFRAGVAGSSHLVLVKDRGGEGPCVQEEVAAVVNFDPAHDPLVESSLRVSFTPPTGVDAAKTAQAKARLEEMHRQMRVFRVWNLVMELGTPEPCSQNTILQRLDGNRRSNTELIDQMVKDGFLVRDRKGQSLLYSTSEDREPPHPATDDLGDSF